MWKLPSGNFIPGRFGAVKRFKRFVREFFTTRHGSVVASRLSGTSWLGAAARLGDGVAAEWLHRGTSERWLLSSARTACAINVIKTVAIKNESCKMKLVTK